MLVPGDQALAGAFELSNSGSASLTDAFGYSVDNAKYRRRLFLGIFLSTK